MPERHIFSRVVKRLRFAEQTAVQVERGAQAVTVQDADQPPILRDAVVITERERFLFAVPHSCHFRSEMYLLMSLYSALSMIFRKERTFNTVSTAFSTR